MNSDRAIATELASAPWLCGLLQSTDSLYPTGSYAHSFGLEGLIQQAVVRDRTTLRELLLRTALPALAHAELPMVAHAWRALAAEDWPQLGELCVLSSALKAPQEARTASEKIGRQRAELAAALHPGTVATEYVHRAAQNGWPHAATVSAAVEARALGAPLVAAMAAYAYSALAALLAAAMKLLRLGQNAAQSLLTEVLSQIPGLIAQASDVAVEDIGWFNPWLDIAASRHESADARMFIS